MGKSSELLSLCPGTEHWPWVHGSSWELAF